MEKNTYLLDSEMPAETVRLMVQHHMMTEGMGGLFPELGNLENVDFLLEAILDVGCGSGDWVLDVAFAYSDAEVVGIDSSPTLIAYNQAQAAVQRLDNVKFFVMDALEPLTFETGTFDLVNIRFASAFVPRDQWRTLLQNCLQVLRPGGTLRVTEAEIVGLTNSLAVEKMHAWTAHLLHAKGYGFSPDGSHIGTLPMLGQLLQEAGCVNVKSKPHLLDFSMGTAGHSSQYQNYMAWPILLKSLLLTTLSIPEEEFDQTYQQMQSDLYMPQFRGLWSLLTIWGERKQENT